MNADNKTHAKYSASGAHRWIACPACVRLGEGVPEKASRYADEGSVAHGIAEECLSFGLESAAQFEGETREFGGETFEVTEEMVEGVDCYLSRIRAAASQAEIDAGEAIVLQEVTLTGLQQLHPDLGGTADCAVIQRKAKKLKVFDFKYGKVVVAAVHNPQLMLYGLGVLLTCEKAILLDVETVELVIVQPRAKDVEGNIVRSWSLPVKELHAWREAVLMPAIGRCSNSEAKPVTGEHCRFCRALAICPAQQAQQLEVARTGLLNPQPPAPETLTDEQIVRVLNAAELIKEWAAKVKAYAQSRLEGGAQLPGFKLVAKRANRKWVGDLGEITSTLESYLGQDACWVRKLVSPAQAEKALKKAGQCAEEIVGRLAEKPDAGLVIAPESDKRPAVQAAPFQEHLEMFQ